MSDDNSTSAEVQLPEEKYPKPFGNYLLLTPIARGGMGEVYLAKHGGLAGIEKHCVVKTLRPHFTMDREYVTRFMDEARVVVHLSHRNICQVYEAGRVGHRYYLAMELIIGNDVRTLYQKLRDGGTPLSEELIIHITMEILEALDYAHRHADPSTGEPLNLVHRDVSPQNVMVNFEGEVKLIDFGLAASSKKVEQTQPNVVMGKMAYMSPEQARGGDVDGRADLFAAAVLCYEMLAGERYYEGLSFDQMWGLAGKGNHSPRRWENIPPELQGILSKALAADLDARYRTCGDFRDELSNYQYNKRMRAGSRELREVMLEVFAQERTNYRELLSQFANVRMMPPQHTADTSKSFAVADGVVPGFEDEVTGSGGALAGTGPFSGTTNPTLSQSALNARAEPTLMVRNFPGSVERSEPIQLPGMGLAAKLGVIGVIAGLVVALVVVILVKQPADPQVVVVQQALPSASSTDAPVVTPSVASVATPPVEHKAATTPPTANLQKNAAAQHAPANVPPPLHPVTKRKTVKKPTAHNPVAKKKPVVRKPFVSRKTPKKTPAKELSAAALAADISTPFAQISFLKRYCKARVSCLQPILKTLKGGDTAINGAFKRRVARCVKRCGR